ncbi:hypothetical protein [Sporosarcina sp. SAFN-015]|uniref:hypothetical protein n=1 Tax=Sporosarcina sp. SAFN-015 TaxID=3387274 RepID=UPI003F7E425A
MMNNPICKLLENFTITPLIRIVVSGNEHFNLTFTNIDSERSLAFFVDNIGNPVVIDCSKISLIEI